MSKKRQSVRGPLFKRQIHRRHLEPIKVSAGECKESGYRIQPAFNPPPLPLCNTKVIGMGQFGEVYLANQEVRMGTGDNGSNQIKRAVKLLRQSASANDRVGFLDSD